MNILLHIIKSVGEWIFGVIFPGELRIIMAKLDDVKAALAALQTSLDAAKTDVEKLAADFHSAPAPVATEADLDDIVTDVTAKTAEVDAIRAAAQE